MAVSYDYYRIFYYVGKYKSISRAAEILLNSQPNITRAMNNLEDQLGCTLLIRSNKGIELTDAGKKLYDHVEVAMEHISAGEREITESRELKSGELFIAATEIALHQILLPALQAFRKKYPGIRIKVSNYSSFEAIDAVKKKRAELALVSLTEKSAPGLSGEVLATYSEVLTTGKDYARLAEKTYTLAELKEYPWISLNRDTQTFRFYDELFRKNGLLFEPELQAATMDQLLPMVKRDLGLAFLPSFIAEPAIRQGEIVRIDTSEHISSRNICLLHEDKRKLSAPARALIDILNQEKLTEEEVK